MWNITDKNWKIQEILQPWTFEFRNWKEIPLPKNLIWQKMNAPSKRLMTHFHKTILVFFSRFGISCDMTWHAIKLNYKIWFDSHESESFYFSDCTFVLYTIGNINQGFCDLRDTDHACMLYSAPPSPIVQYTCRNICMIWASVGGKIHHNRP